MSVEVTLIVDVVPVPKREQQAILRRAKKLFKEGVPLSYARMTFAFVRKKGAAFRLYTHLIPCEKDEADFMIGVSDGDPIVELSGVKSPPSEEPDDCEEE